MPLGEAAPGRLSGYFFTIPGMLFEILLGEGMPAKWYEEGAWFAGPAIRYCF